MSEPEFTECVFVIGAPRSATSAMGWALAAHPDFCTGPESDFIHLLFGRGAAREAYSSSLRRTEVTGWLERNNVDFNEFLKYMGYGVDCLFRSRATARRWVDSTPTYTLMAQDLAFMFPRARFIHMMRDGRAVVSSMINSGFNTAFAKDFETACRTWRDFIRAGRKHEQHFPDRTMAVRQERLQSDADAIFEDVLRFLGAPAHPGPARFISKKVINSSFAQKTAGGKRKELPSPPPKPAPWQDWSEAMRKTFQRVAGETMIEMGYAGVLVE